MNNTALLLRSTILGVAFLCTAGVSAQSDPQRPLFRHVKSPQEIEARNVARRDSINAANKKDGIKVDESLRVRDVDEIIDNMIISPDVPTFNRLLAPWVFSEYRPLDRMKKVSIPDFSSQSVAIWTLADRKIKAGQKLTEEMDSIAERKKYLDELWGRSPAAEEEVIAVEDLKEDYPDVSPLLGNPRPKWLENAYEAWNMQDDFMYSMMVETPSKIEYAYWLLPVPPKLKDEDYSFHGFLKRNSVSGININEAVIKEAVVEKKHWLHVFNSALQFSQAFLSPNWYQGGNNHVALFVNFLWDVQLNTVWHPNMLFQSTLSYRLGLNSVEDDPHRKYSISQDLFQYNVKFGYKARRNWYYSLTGQFKTQLLNNYKKGEKDRIASFLTPGDLNVGLGMTYSIANKKKTAQFNASIAPLSYNLRTAICMKVDHGLFNMNYGQRCQSEFGSNADLTLNWNVSKIINYKSRLFLFTDYKYAMGDWENTFNFQFSKLFSAQIFVNMRYDSSTPATMLKMKDADGNVIKDENGKDVEIRSRWSKFMLKEILSIGLSYQFSTKK